MMLGRLWGRVMLASWVEVTNLICVVAEINFTVALRSFSPPPLSFSGFKSYSHQHLEILPHRRVSRLTIYYLYHNCVQSPKPA